MLVATVSAGNEVFVLSTDFVVVAIKVSMGCKGHFESLLSMIVRECVLY